MSRDKAMTEMTNEGLVPFEVNPNHTMMTSMTCNYSPFKINMNNAHNHQSLRKCIYIVTNKNKNQRKGK
jgi:hypothetical protein